MPGDDAPIGQAGRNHCRAIAQRFGRHGHEIESHRGEAVGQHAAFAGAWSTRAPIRRIA